MAKRRKRPPKSAYLKRARTFPDPHHPWAMKTRSARAINLSGLMRDPNTKLLYDAGTPTTVTHGKRGLTIARAQGPTAVAKHADGKSTVIPKMQVQLRKEEVVALERDPRGRLREWNHITRIDLKPHYSLELFFHGREWVWVEKDDKWERWSRSYPDRERAEWAYEHKITWEEVFPIPNTS